MSRNYPLQIPYQCSNNRHNSFPVRKPQFRQMHLVIRVSRDLVLKQREDFSHKQTRHVVIDVLRIAYDVRKGENHIEATFTN